MTTSFLNGSFVSGVSSATTSSLTNGITSDQLYNTSYLDRRNDYNQTSESYDIASVGRDAAIDVSISTLTSYIANGQEDKVIAAYNELLNQMSTQTRYAQLITEDGDDTQLRAVARQLIELETGVNLEQFIRENTRDSIEVQKQQKYRGEYCDSTTQEELLEAMCNLEEEEGHLNIFQEGWHGFFGAIAQGWNSIFGDGKKH